MGVTNDDVKPKNQADEAVHPRQPRQPVQAAQATNAENAGSAPQAVNKGKAVRDIALYGFLRLLLFLVLTFIIHSIVILLGMANYFPLLVSMTLALILALPLSMFMFKGLRLRVTEQVAAWDADRQAHKQELRNQLRERLDD